MQQERNSPFLPEFWKELARAKGHGPAKRSLSPQCWDKAASHYDDLEECEDYLRQVEGVMNTLISRNIVQAHVRVLDVGCGTGTYAIRMAPLVHEVVALDSSEAMLNVLRSKIEESGFRNIRPVAQDWRTYTPSAPFDLVFASMTPIFRHLDLVDKLLATSKRYVVLVSWARIKENPVLHRLFMEFLGEDPQKGPGRPDIFLLFNYLYTQGYAPDLRFFHGCWRRKRSKESQVEHLLWQLEMHMDLDDAKKRRVTEVVDAMGPSEEIEVVTRVRTCLMVIDKAARYHRCP